MTKDKNKVSPEMQRKMAIEYYKRNPVVFVSRELEVDLYWWQKVLLNFTFKWGFKNG